MADLVPFRGLRYDERVAGALGSLVSPPYDVISPERRAALLARSERNFVRVELPDPTPRGHAAASDLLQRWMREGVLRPEHQPALYVDEHSFRLGDTTMTRTEVLVALRLYEISAGVVLPHERTFPSAKAERLELLRATRANTSPVFGMFMDENDAIAQLRRAPVAAVATAAAGEETHRLSVITDVAAIDAFSKALAPTRIYIADGHHRYETALNYADERQAGDAHTDRFVLAALCAMDDRGLRILSTHRIVHDGDTALDAAAARSFEATPIDRAALGDTGIALARDGRFTRLAPRADADLSALPPAWRRLPVAVAEELLLAPARDAGAHITYEHDTDAAIAAARNGASAIVLAPVTPSTLREVANMGERMPQKTTYFYPKVPAGLVIRSLDLD